MQLGEIIRNFTDEARANEALLACENLVLFARVDKTAARYEETMGEYAAGAIRRFANQALSEDWLALMNVLERSDDPGTGCLVFMVEWSLNKDEPQAVVHKNCTCGGGGQCA